MKKIFSTLILLIFFHLASIGQDVYIYNSKGDKIYFNRTGRNVIRIENISDSNVVKEIEMLDSNAIVLTNQQVISDINTSRIRAFSAKSSISTTELLSIGEEFYWVEKNGIILKMKPGIDVDSLLNLNNIGYKKREQLGSDESVFIVELQNGYDAISICNSLFESGNVVFAQPNWGMYGKFAQNDRYSYQWNLHTNSAYDINVEAAWNLAEGEGIKVAVLDEGIELTHPDLVANLLPGYDATDGSQVGGEGSHQAGDDHGTRCAGIIAAADNSIGIKGIAYKSKIIPIRIAYSDPNRQDKKWKSTTEWNVNAIEYAWRTVGADVLSNSWSYRNNFDDAVNYEINRAIQYGRGGKGCIVVFAAGNYDSNEVKYPSYLPNVISVGAMSPCGERKSPTSCDGETSWGSNYGSGLNVVAPGVLIPTTDINSGYVNNFNGTSAACPHVAGVAALMLSANPNLTSAQVKNIIEQTAQKIRPDLYVYTNTSTHPNGTWNDSVGYGLVDAYAAVMKAIDVDLYISDTTGDNGAENLALKYMWNSPDIWIEELGGGSVDNPIGGRTYNVCVRIHNKSNVPSTGNERLFINWAKAGVNLPWPGGWDGSRTIDCDGEKYMSGSVTYSNGEPIPVIPANSSYTKKVQWFVPFAEDYNCGIFEGSAEQLHFCLLARVHDDDTIVGENLNSYPIDTFVTQNNNVAWKNISIINGAKNKAVVWLQNHLSTTQMFRLHFTAHPNSKNELLGQYAETYIRLSPNVYEAWNASGRKGTGISEAGENRLRITENNATLKDISLPANAVGMLETEVNFLSEVIPQDKTFTFDIAMYDSKGKTLYGGEHYKAIRDDNRTFDVVAMQNQTAMAQESITFSAINIGEPATYLWYNAAGDSIASGTTLSTTATQSQQYRLSVQATADGYKGYDTVSLVVRNGAITSLSPNPTSGHAVVTYNLTSSVSAASIVVTNSSGLAVYSSAINVSATTHTLNVQNLVAGQYSVRLVSATGEVLDSKTLIVQ